MEHAVDQEPEDLAADLRHHDEALVVAVLSETQQLPEPNKRQKLIAQPQHGRVLDPLDAMLATIGGAHEFEHGKLRNGETLGAGFDDERGDDRERQRYFDRERRAGAGRGFQIDRAADLLDIGAHHVHADAAAGNAGDRRSGGEARREDQIADLGIGLGGDFALDGETDLGGLGADARQIEATAVVGDLDDDVAALVAGGQADAADRRLAGRESFG